jgi:hypothetical protein
VPCPLVEVEHLEPDPFEPQLAEAEVEKHAERIGAITLRRVGRIADDDPNPAPPFVEPRSRRSSDPTGR